MNAEILRNMLIGTANSLGWVATAVPDFVLPRFRGRDDASAEPLEHVYGLRLGSYPVVVAPVTLGTMEEMQAALRRLHTQVVIARSYMRADEVINAHLMLCAVNPSPPGESEDASLGDWRSVVDLAQRDEAVCRKIIWIPDQEAVEASYLRFAARTFLAMPWRTTGQVLDAALDRNQGLAESMLVKNGLDESTAAEWVRLVGREGADADAMVAALATARRDA